MRPDAPPIAPHFCGLYAITDTELQPDSRRLLAQVKAALLGGVRVVQYRDKKLSFARQVGQAAALKDLCHEHQALFVVNNHLPLAQAVQADGLHIGQNDSDLLTARATLGPNCRIGVSCYNELTRAQTLRTQGADYVAFGRFFPSKTKPHATPADPAILTRAQAQLDCPIVAIGGIRLDNAAALIEAGADSLAVIHALWTAPDIQAYAQQLTELIARTRESKPHRTAIEN